MHHPNRVAIVTGSESGIGYAVTEVLLANEYIVVGADLNNRNTPHERSGNFTFVPTDVTSTRELDSLFSSTINRFGRLDALVNSAGVTGLDTIYEITDESWNRIIDVNLKAVFFTSQKALTIMTDQGFGKIVNLSSNAGKSGGKAVGAHYSASKAGVICLTRSLAQYAAEFGVHVNCVAPGPTRTPMTDEWEEQVSRSLIGKIPLGRFAEPSEIAEAIMFLLSEKSDFITGETLNVNGGLLMD